MKLAFSNGNGRRYESEFVSENHNMFFDVSSKLPFPRYVGKSSLDTWIGENKGWVEHHTFGWIGSIVINREVYFLENRYTNERPLREGNANSAMARGDSFVFDEHLKVGKLVVGDESGEIDKAFYRKLAEYGFKEKV